MDEALQKLLVFMKSVSLYSKDRNTETKKIKM